MSEELKNCPNYPTLEKLKEENVELKQTEKELEAYKDALLDEAVELKKENADLRANLKASKNANICMKKVEDRLRAKLAEYEQKVGVECLPDREELMEVIEECVNDNQFIGAMEIADAILKACRKKPQCKKGDFFIDADDLLRVIEYNPDAMYEIKAMGLNGAVHQYSIDNVNIIPFEELLKRASEEVSDA